MEQRLQELFLHQGDDDTRLCAGVEKLAEHFGDRVYQESLRYLVGKYFAAEKAARYWHAALAHRDGLFAAGGNRPGLRPALLDYLHRVVREIRDPRIIESDLLENIRRASVTDGLTGLCNQTYFKRHLARLLERRRRSGAGQLAVLLFDLDHFKQYNDRCGHLSGDEALRRVGAIISECIREGDLAARYGGEEFAVLLTRIPRQPAFQVAERIRRAVERADFPGQNLLDRGKLTISGGIAFYPEEGESPQALIDRADRELYRAKRLRNRISPAHRERRHDFRHPLRSLVEYRLPRAAETRAALSCDISRAGLGFDCDTELPPGTSLEIRLPHPFWPADRCLESTVRYARRDPASAMVRIGLEFCDTAGQLEALLPHIAGADTAAFPSP